MSNKNQIRAEDVRFRVLRLLQENPAISQRNIAKALGLSLGGVNHCLNALVEKGHIKMRNFQESKDKRKLCVSADAQGNCRKDSPYGEVSATQDA